MLLTHWADKKLSKLDGVGVFATAPCVSYHADCTQRAFERSELCTPSEQPPLSPSRSGAIAPGRLVFYKTLAILMKFCVQFRE